MNKRLISIPLTMRNRMVFIIESRIREYKLDNPDTNIYGDISEMVFDLLDEGYHDFRRIYLALDRVKGNP